MLLLHNEKNGTFKDVTEAAGIVRRAASGLQLGLTFIDYDHDGDLDLYVTHYIEPVGRSRIGMLGPVVSPATVVPSVMWRNNGNGTFTERHGFDRTCGTSPSLGAVGHRL